MVNIDTLGEKLRWLEKNYSSPHEICLKHLLPGGSRGPFVQCFSGTIAVKLNWVRLTAEQAGVSHWLIYAHNKIYATLMKLNGWRQFHEQSGLQISPKAWLPLSLRLSLELVKHNCNYSFTCLFRIVKINSLGVGRSHGRRSLVGCSPWGQEESDTTEQLHFHFSLSCIGEGNGNPLQCSCLKNLRNGGAWWAAVSGVAQSQTRLKRLSSSSSSSSRNSLIHLLYEAPSM